MFVDAEQFQSRSSGASQWELGKSRIALRKPRTSAGLYTVNLARMFQSWIPGRMSSHRSKCEWGERSFKINSHDMRVVKAWEFECGCSDEMRRCCVGQQGPHCLPQPTKFRTSLPAGSSFLST
jgi:hypothetical protein